MRWNHLFHSSSQVELVFNSPHERWTWIIGAPKQDTLQSFFTSGNRKKSQGERSEEFGGCGTAISRYHWKSHRCTCFVGTLPMVCVCVCELSEWVSERERRSQSPSCLRVALAPNFEDLRESEVLTLVCSDCPFVLMKNCSDVCPIFWRNSNRFLCAFFCLFVCVCVCVGGGGVVVVVVAFQIPVHICSSKLRYLSTLPRSFLNDLRRPFSMWIRTTKPYSVVCLSLSLFVRQRVGDPHCILFSHMKIFVQCEYVHCRSEAKTFRNLSSGNPRFSPDECFHCLNVSNRNNSFWNAAPVLIIKSHLTSPDLTIDGSVLPKRASDS